MRRLPFVMALCWLTLPPSPAAVRHPKAPPVNGNLFSRAQQSVIRSLKDPESARFRAMREVKYLDGFGTKVCGEVNAKNSFGGYVGFRRFMFDPKFNFSLIHPDDEQWQELSPDDRLTYSNAFVECYR